MAALVHTLDVRDVRSQFVTIVGGFRGNILILGSATESGARFELRTQPTAPDDEGELLRVELHVRNNPRIMIVDAAGAARKARNWSMVCGIVNHDVTDVMGEVFEWVQVRLLLQLGRRRRAKMYGELMSVVLQPLREVIHEVANAAIDCCDPAARSLALAFDPHLRFRVYARLVNDTSGRLADLVSSCPGALIFALSLIERRQASSSVAAGERLLSDVISGRRLNPAIDDAIDGWLASIAQCHGTSPVRWKRPRARTVGPDARVRSALQETGAVLAWQGALAQSPRVSLQARQRLLIRRAGPEVATDSLWLPPPLVLVPEDIPRDERDNARWFKVMKSHAFTLARHDAIDPAWQDALCRFLSRHAAALTRVSDTAPAMPVQAVLDYAHAEGRWLDRNSDPARVRASWGRWHDEVSHRESLELLEAKLRRGDITLTRVLPAPHFDSHALCSSELELLPITSVGGVFEEAREMHHCVAEHIVDALAGKALVFRGVVHGERVTVELARTGTTRKYGPWTLRDLRRRRNHTVGPAASAAIRAWATQAVAFQQAAEIEAPPVAVPRDDAFECPF